MPAKAYAIILFVLHFQPSGFLAYASAGVPGAAYACPSFCLIQPQATQVRCRIYTLSATSAVAIRRNCGRLSVRSFIDIKVSLSPFCDLNYGLSACPHFCCTSYPGGFGYSFFLLGRYARGSWCGGAAGSSRSLRLALRFPWVSLALPL